MIWYFFFACVMAMVVAHVADSKGQPVGAWLLYGLFLWPVALIHILLTDPAAPIARANAIRTGQEKKCPDCAELVKGEARKCRFCGLVFTTDGPAAAVNPNGLAWGSKSTDPKRKFATSWKPQ